MKSEKQIREHIELLDRAIDFMKKNKEKGAKKEWINRWQMYVELLKWVVNEPSEYEEVYKNIESLRNKTIKNNIPDVLGLTGTFLHILVKNKDGVKVNYMKLAPMFYKFAPKDKMKSIILNECKSMAKKAGQDADNLNYFIDNSEILPNEIKDILGAKLND